MDHDDFEDCLRDLASIRESMPATHSDLVRWVNRMAEEVGEQMQFPFMSISWDEDGALVYDSANKEPVPSYLCPKRGGYANHHFVRYEGFREVYEYCEYCDIKRPVENR